MSTPDKALTNILKRAYQDINNSAISDHDIRSRIEYVCRQISNRACTRLLMACLLAKIDRPDVDPRKPY